MIYMLTQGILVGFGRYTQKSHQPGTSPGIYARESFGYGRSQVSVSFVCRFNTKCAHVVFGFP